MLLTNRHVCSYPQVQNHVQKHRHDWCHGNHNDEHYVVYTGTLVKHSDMHVQAWFDGMLYQILRLAVIRGIDALSHRYRLNELGYAAVQVVLLHEFFLQFQASITQLWLRYRHEQHGVQWLEVYTVINDLRWFLKLFHGLHRELKAQAVDCPP
ncbi:hypothetical protein D3C75_978020 [compost metagenome]